MIILCYCQGNQYLERLLNHFKLDTPTNLIFLATLSLSLMKSAFIFLRCPGSQGQRLKLFLQAKGVALSPKLNF